MEIYKIVAVGIVSAIILVYLKSVNSELAMPAGIVAGIILLVMTASYVSEFVGFFKSLTESAGIDPSFFKLTVKIIAISYLVEFSSSLIEDFGMKSISDKVVFAGRVLVLTLSVPIIKNLIEVVVGFL